MSAVFCLNGTDGRYQTPAISLKIVLPLFFSFTAAWGLPKVKRVTTSLAAAVSFPGSSKTFVGQVHCRRGLLLLLLSLQHSRRTGAYPVFQLPRSVGNLHNFLSPCWSDSLSIRRRYWQGFTRKPIVATLSKSSKPLILLVACRMKAFSISSGAIPHPLSETLIDAVPPRLSPR